MESNALFFFWVLRLISSFSASNLAAVLLKVAEISRVLRPGGVFVATTYILDGPFDFVPFLKDRTKVYASYLEPTVRLMSRWSGIIIPIYDTGFYFLS